MNPRHRRLTSDYQSLVDAFAGHPHIQVNPVGPLPPERYRIVYTVPGLRSRPTAARPGPSRPRSTSACPRGTRGEAVPDHPDAVFHPNFGAHICIADFWSPSQSLLDIVVQVGDMLQWRTYNVRSPLNAVAANWAQENTHQLPVGNADVTPLHGDVVLVGTPTTGTDLPQEARA